jgi:hypothetical protein
VVIPAQFDDYKIGAWTVDCGVNITSNSVPPHIVHISDV